MSLFLAHSAQQDETAKMGKTLLASGLNVLYVLHILKIFPYIYEHGCDVGKNLGQNYPDC